MIRKISFRDYGSIAAMHGKSISEAFFSKLGNDFLAYLYSSFTKQKQFFGFVHVDNKEDITGFITIAAGKSFFSRFLRSNLIHFSYNSFVGIIKHPSAILDLLRTTICLIKDDVKAQSELFSIAVHDKDRYKGIGAKLIEEAKKELHRRGINDMKGLVDARLKANTFYAHNGFLQYKTV